MKNEERIIELLTEILRKSDQYDEVVMQNKERMEQNEERLSNSEKLIFQHQERLNNLDDISAGVLTLLRDLAKRSGETDELRDRIERLEKHAGL